MNQIAEDIPSKAKALLKIIVKKIEDERIKLDKPETFLSYSEAIELLDLHPSGERAGRRLQREGLTELNEWTIRHPELPKVCGLIVNKSNKKPSSGYPESHGRKKDSDWHSWWLDECNKSISHDWTTYLQ